MDNIRGSLFMVLAMVGFALEDTFIKLLTADLPVGQILVMIGMGGCLIFALITRIQGNRVFTRHLLSLPVMLRNFGELASGCLYISALALTPLSSVSAILQAAPLAVTLGAALFLGEAVGWRRWSAIIVGFCGVLMVVRPGLEGFEPASLLAVASVIGLALRDLATRRIPQTVKSTQLACYGFAAIIPAGLFLLAFVEPARALSSDNWLYIAIAWVVGGTGYYAIVTATRIGEVSVVMPFRYTRLLFALIIGVLVFSERPDAWTLGGAALIIGSGVYTLLREARLRRRLTPKRPGRL